MKNATYIELFNKNSYAVLLKLIIEEGNIKELYNSLKHNVIVKTLSKSHNYFLSLSYKTKNLDIAEFLLGYGIGFDIKHFAYLDKDTNKAADHINHLNNIKSYLSKEQFDLAFSYIAAFHSKPLFTLESQNCFRVEDVLMSITYTNDKNKVDLIKLMYKNLYLNSAPIVKDILTTIAIYPINLKNPEFWARNFVKKPAQETAHSQLYVRLSCAQFIC